MAATSLRRGFRTYARAVSYDGPDHRGDDLCHFEWGEVLKPNRNWVILRLEEDNLWRQVTASYAPTRRAAIDMATQGADNPYSEGTFIALPAKAWGKQVVKP